MIEGMVNKWPPHRRMAVNDAFFERPSAASGAGASSPPPVPAAPPHGMAEASLRQVAQQLLSMEAGRVQRGEIGRDGWLVMGNRLQGHILQLLGDVPAHALAGRHAQQLIDRLGAQGLSSTTISQYLVLLRKLAACAVQMGALPELPVFPKVKVRSQPRGSFTVREYRTLAAAARALRGQPHPQLARLQGGKRFWVARELLHMPEELPWLIRWMVNTFVRPSDIKFVQHRHVEIVRDRHIYLRLRLPETKRHAQPMVSLRPAVHVYEQLLARRRAQGLAAPDDYLFLPQIANRDHALAVLGFLFQWVLRHTGLHQGPQGQPRTLYCLRHTAITLRLLHGQGIDMLTLARNARTSVNMIERFYASALSGEMNVGLLQSRRGRVR